MIGLQHYLTLSAVLFSLSVAGIFLNRRNLIGAESELEQSQQLVLVDLGGLPAENRQAHGQAYDSDSQKIFIHGLNWDLQELLN